jgi:transcriptional regulator with XRE-family HTH domain
MATGRRSVGAFTLALVAEIRATAGRRNITQAQIARATGISPQTVSNIYRGRSAIDAEQLEAFAGALGVEVAHLFDAARASMHEYEVSDTGA